MPRRSPATEFTRRVLMALRRVPPGRVTTYGAIAALAGRPGAARAVGNIMQSAPVPGLPYHRVIAAGGRLGGFGGATRLKAALLEAEGLIVRGQRIVEYRQAHWPGPPATSRPRRAV